MIRLAQQNNIGQVLSELKEFVLHFYLVTKPILKYYCSNISIIIKEMKNQ